MHNPRICFGLDEWRQCWFKVNLSQVVSNKLAVAELSQFFIAVKCRNNHYV